VCAKVRGQCDSSNDEEKNVQSIDDHRQDWHYDGRVADSGCDEVDERQHREYGDKHHVVDNGRVAIGGIVDHVTDECNDEQSPEELKCSQRKLGDLHCECYVCILFGLRRRAFTRNKDVWERQFVRVIGVFESRG